jgi:hypothetical protein
MTVTVKVAADDVSDFYRKPDGCGLHCWSTPTFTAVLAASDQ